MKKLALFHTALVLSIFVVSLIGCGGDSEESAQIAGTEASVDNNKDPEIVYSFPADGQQDIAHDERIVIKFSEAIDQEKFWKSFHFTPVIDLTGWTPSWSGKTVTINPPIGTQPFDLNTEYTIVIPRNGVVDLYGHSMVSDYTITFKTLRYPVEKIKGSITFTGRPTMAWLFTVGKANSLWAIYWGGTRDPNGPAWSSPGGTITASADGRIDEKSIETWVSEAGYPVTYSVTKGNGNSLTFTGATSGLDYSIMFDSTSSYLTFDLRSGGTVPKEYVSIGPDYFHPSRTPFILKNK